MEGRQLNVSSNRKIDLIEISLKKVNGGRQRADNYPCNCLSMIYNAIVYQTSRTPIFIITLLVKGRARTDPT